MLRVRTVSTIDLRNRARSLSPSSFTIRRTCVGSTSSQLETPNTIVSVSGRRTTDILSGEGDTTAGRVSSASIEGIVQSLVIFTVLRASTQVRTLAFRVIARVEGSVGIRAGRLQPRSFLVGRTRSSLGSSQLISPTISDSISSTTATNRLITVGDTTATGIIIASGLSSRNSRIILTILRTTTTVLTETVGVQATAVNGACE